jgi:hypothetical protein
MEADMARLRQLRHRLEAATLEADAITDEASRLAERLRNELQAIVLLDAQTRRITAPPPSQP